jgi:Fe-S-cluster-containing dehydrogenase component
MAACPSEAISKRHDGIVIFSENRCIGCGECAEACPFGAPQYHPEKEIFQACNLCCERIDKGLKPACVQHCPTEALIFGDPNALSNLLREKTATPLLHRRLTTSTKAG